MHCVTVRKERSLVDCDAAPRGGPATTATGLILKLQEGRSQEWRNISWDRGATAGRCLSRTPSGTLRPAKRWSGESRTKLTGWPMHKRIFQPDGAARGRWRGGMRFIRR